MTGASGVFQGGDRIDPGYPISQDPGPGRVLGSWIWVPGRVLEGSWGALGESWRGPGGVLGGVLEGPGGVLEGSRRVPGGVPEGAWRGPRGCPEGSGRTPIARFRVSKDLWRRGILAIFPVLARNGHFPGPQILARRPEFEHRHFSLPNAAQILDTRADSSRNDTLLDTFIDTFGHLLDTFGRSPLI